jgi:phosphatidylethanolamine-binding protein (PEBP) family uncharacterized protein
MQRLKVSCGNNIFSNAMDNTHKLIVLSKEQIDTKLKIRIFFDTPDDASKKLHMILFIDLDANYIHYWVSNITFKYHNIDEVLENNAKIETFDIWQSFEKPNPPNSSGNHRYIIHLFEQMNKLENPHFSNRILTTMSDLQGVKLIDKKGIVIKT